MGICTLLQWSENLFLFFLIRFVKPMESKTVPLGDTAVIECLASGSPKPRLTWTKDGGKLEATERHFFTADNQLLIIVKARESDAGRYECSMHNQARRRIHAILLCLLFHIRQRRRSLNVILNSSSAARHGEPVQRVERL